MLVAFALFLKLTLPAAANPGRFNAEQECPIAINEVATLEREQYRFLLEMRGGNWPVADALTRNLQENVESYLSYRQYPGDVRSRGLLLYIGNADFLCAMYWRVGETASDSVFIAERVTVPPSQLVPLIDNLVVEMQRSDPNTLRSAYRKAGQVRGGGSLATGRAKPTQDILAELSGILFPGEIAAYVSDLASLSILPCLNIGIVPFAALDPDHDGKPFVETTVINIESELQHIFDERAFGWDGQIQSPAIFGNPSTSLDDEWAFSLLPGAEREAVEIATRLGTQPLLGEFATRERVLGEIAGADYVHIAAHGISSVESPLDGSFLALADGRLTARDILGIKLTGSPLVVLSACQTGLGGPLDAGVIGLARSFVLAGASATMATLWNVDDEVTAAIMIDFVTNLETMSPPAALRVAQQRARELNGHPKFWSGFMLFGSRTVTL